jgi:hypothetical protein
MLPELSLLEICLRKRSLKVLDLDLVLGLNSNQLGWFRYPLVLVLVSDLDSD